jgi:C_GCAxxG_C_C family probable redox protein
MITRKVEILLPQLPEEEIIQKSIDLTDYYLTKKCWPSHQSVFKAVSEIFGIIYQPEILRLLSGFTAGVGFTGNICGALCGGTAVLGYIYGSEEPMPDEIYKPFIATILAEDITPHQKAEKLISAVFSYSFLYNKLVEDFRKDFGHCNCSELISPYREDPISRSRFGRCRRIVSGTGGLTARIILDIEKGKINQAMGENIYSHLLKDD